MDDDSTGYAVTASEEACDEDIKLLEGLSNEASSSDHGKGGGVEVNTERKTKAELDDEAFDEFKSQVSGHLRKYQDFDLEARQLAKFLLTAEFAESLLEGLKKHMARLTKVVLMLSKACEQDLEKSMFKKLSAAMKHVRDVQTAMMAHGQKFGWKSPVKRRRIITE